MVRNNETNMHWIYLFGFISLCPQYKHGFQIKTTSMIWSVDINRKHLNGARLVITQYLVTNLPLKFHDSRNLLQFRCYKSSQYVWKCRVCKMAQVKPSSFGNSWCSATSRSNGSHVTTFPSLCNGPLEARVELVEACSAHLFQLPCRVRHED